MQSVPDPHRRCSWSGHSVCRTWDLGPPLLGPRHPQERQWGQGREGLEERFQCLFTLRPRATHLLQGVLPGRLRPGRSGRRRILVCGTVVGSCYPWTWLQAPDLLLTCSADCPADSPMLRAVPCAHLGPSHSLLRFVSGAMCGTVFLRPGSAAGFCANACSPPSLGVLCCQNCVCCFVSAVAWGQ